MFKLASVPKATLTAQLVKRKVGKAKGALKLRTGVLDATPDRKPLLKGVFSGYS